MSLTKTVKKGKEAKENLIQQIRTALDSYSTVYIFCVENMRTEILQTARAELKGRARFFIGKKSVMAKALGCTPEEEQRDNISQLANMLSGEVGLLFVREEVPSGYTLNEEEGEGVISEEELINYLDSLEQPEFARPGTVAPETITVPAGPLKTSDGVPIPNNLEGQIRQCGLQVSLVRGVVVVPEGSERAICNEGDKLTPEQARLLKLLNYPLVTFRIKLIARYRNGFCSKMSSDDSMSDEQEN